MCGEQKFTANRLIIEEKIRNRRFWQMKGKKLYLKIVVALSLVILLGGGQKFFAPFQGEDPESIMEVVYPQAYAFENHNARVKLWEENPLDEEFIHAMQGFSYRTATEILKSADGNSNYSPASLYFALALATTGAKDETRGELLNLLGVDDVEILSEQSGNYYRRLYKDNEIGQLKIANSYWMDEYVMDQPVKFHQDFIDNAVENFYTETFLVDFSKREAGKIMGEWVASKTKGTLSPSFEVDPEQILSIINTIYFYDQWVDRFNSNQTEEDTFALSDGSEVTTDFMNQTYSAMNFSRGEGFTRAGRSLKNGGRMVFVLPDEGVTPQEFFASPDSLKEAFEGGKGYFGEVEWKVPKFSFNSSFDLTEAMNTLGVNKAFSEEADFTGMTDHFAFISEVKQETHIAIDEEGVTASSFTQIIAAGSGLPEDQAEMILDRPFLYGIKSGDGTFLFIGVVENPEE